MRRVALLLPCGRATGEKELPGVELDYERIREYLTLGVGGGWEESEIVDLWNPDYGELASRLESLSGYDYMFIWFGGHGEHPRAARIQDLCELNTRLVLGDGSIIKAHHLEPLAPKCLIMIDACRNLAPLTESFAQPITPQIKIAAKVPDIGIYREKFKQIVRNSRDRVDYVFSCRIGTSAWEHPQEGGLFTQSIIDQAMIWQAMRPLQGWQGTYQAVLKAYYLMARSGKDQFPIIFPGLRGVRPTFPFAIHVR